MMNKVKIAQQVFGLPRLPPSVSVGAGRLLSCSCGTRLTYNHLFDHVKNKHLGDGYDSYGCGECVFRSSSTGPLLVHCSEFGHDLTKSKLESSSTDVVLARVQDILKNGKESDGSRKGKGSYNSDLGQNEEIIDLSKEVEIRIVKNEKLGDPTRASDIASDDEGEDDRSNVDAGKPRSVANTVIVLKQTRTLR